VPFHHVFKIFSRALKRPLVAGLTLVDLAVYAIILLLGALQFKFYLRTNDFAYDAMYGDLARSLLHKGAYEFNFQPETTLPPGLPLMLAGVGAVLGMGMAVMFHVMAVCVTLGSLLTYELLRRIGNRGVAAAAVLLFASSPALFSFGTQLIFSDLPYFFLSTLVLLLVLNIDKPASVRTPVAQIISLAVVLALAVLTRSAGIALLIGLISWMIASLWYNREQGRQRILRFILPLMLGLAVQALWTGWAQRRHQLEWQLGGWPDSYTANLKIKSGNQPELGNATVADIPARVGKNVVDRADEFVKFMSGRWVSRFWSSPAIGGVILLIAIGLASSLRKGGQLHDWYFLWHEIIYLLWPWDFELRFLLPVAPLACLYLWRGFLVTRNYSLRSPETAGRWIAAVASFLAICSAAFAFHFASFPRDADHLRGDRLQPIGAVLFWSALAILGLVMLSLPALKRLRQTVHHFFASLPKSDLAGILKTAAILLLIVQVGRGARQELVIGRQNAHPDLRASDFYPDIEAAEWIAKHEPPGTVAMARKQDLVFHYSHHHVVWFPPISDARILMDGIQRHRVGVVVVTHPKHQYWLPAEDARFHALMKTYGQRFRLVHQGPADMVFELPSGGD